MSKKLKKDSVYSVSKVQKDGSLKIIGYLSEKYCENGMDIKLDLQEYIINCL